MNNDPFTFSTFLPRTVGFENLLADFGKMSALTSKALGFPPYNIVKKNDNTYEIEMAVAGFGKSNLEIVIEGGLLKIKGSLESGNQPAPDQNYLFKGIAERNFERNFKVADHVEVKNAELLNGILKLTLERLVPEDQKPKKIEINDETPATTPAKKLLQE